MKTLRAFRCFASAVMIFALATGCGTRQGNGMVEVDFEPLGSVAWYDFLLPKAWAAGEEVRFCIDRIRFKNANGQATGDNGNPSDLVFRPGEILVNENGTEVGDIELPSGEYRRVELVLDDVCGTGSSVSVGGASPVATDLRIVLTFNGTFELAADADERLGLKVDAIVDAVRTATNPGQIKVLAEGNSGTF